MPHSQQEIRSYVIRASRFSENQRRYLKEYYPLYGLSFPGNLSWKEIFPSFQKIVVEIGSGNGQTTIEIAKNRPDTAFLAIEVHPPGLGQLLGALHTSQLPNVKVLQHDAVPVVRNFSPNSIDGFHAFFPDPWPKKRHHKRRLLKKPFIETMIMALKPGGYLYFITDWEDYALEIQDLLNTLTDLYNPYPGWAKEISWRPKTKFELKGIQEKRPIRELFFIKKP